LATANRIVAPCSKAAFADWWADTAGSRWVKVPPAALDHRRFWEAMDRLSEDDLRLIEAELGKRMVTEFELGPSGLVLDMTNFATFIDSGNDRAPIAQRGKAKQKRTDLRLVGLGLVVTRDGGIPIVSHAYGGDRPDVTQFSAIVEEPLARYREVTTQGRVVDRRLRRRAELLRQPHPHRGHRDRVRRVAAAERPSRPARDSHNPLPPG
jgi:transposase